MNVERLTAWKQLVSQSLGSKLVAWKQLVSQSLGSKLVVCIVRACQESRLLSKTQPCYDSVHLFIQSHNYRININTSRYLCLHGYLENMYGAVALHVSCKPIAVLSSPLLRAYFKYVASL